MHVFYHLQDEPPQQQRFDDPTIPSHRHIPGHITYAFKKGATIVKNDNFYTLPEGQSKQIDILFLIANAPVKTTTIPEEGSESYVGTAVGMQLATEALSEIFPTFFAQEEEPSKEDKM